MPMREDLLTPIPGDNPSGESLRYDPIYDKIKEARREEEDLSQGAWQHELKTADFPLVIKLTQEVIATRSKDLQLAAWLTEALLRKEGFGGLRDGLDLCHKLVDQFWETVYPEQEEDGDLEMRAAPLEWLGTRMEQYVKSSPLVNEGHGWFAYTESRSVGYEEQVQGDQAKKNREKLIKEGKLAPEEFDRAFVETPKAFYAQAEKDLDACLAGTKSLSLLCDGKFGDVAPSFTRLQAGLEEVRHTIHSLLEKKRETEPDPVEETVEEVAGEQSGEEATGESAPAASGLGRAMVALVSTETGDRKKAVEAAAATAAYLRKTDRGSPAPYLMMRGLRWGELRLALERNDPSLLEAPATDLRQQIKALALRNRWEDLLEAAEGIMALPCSRGWLDLQRFVVEACAALGSDYDAIAKGIRAELRALVRDYPQLPRITLMDDTPGANAETQAWLNELMKEPSATAVPTEADAEAAAEPVSDGEPIAGWRRQFIDGHQLAAEALRTGRETDAFEILQKEVERQRSGRGRFLRKLQLVEMCLASGKEAIAQPILEDLAASIDAHKLEEWEDRDIVAGALLTIMKGNPKIKDDAKEKKKIFDRICRLNPARALEA